MIIDDNSSGTVSRLVYYPVKSLAGISVDQAQLTSRGIEHDRMWMLVKESGRFITQREEHRLALLKVAADGSGFRISTPSGETTWLPTEVAPDAKATVQIWKDDVEATVGPEDAAMFFSDFLGYSCLAVSMPKDAGRMAREFAPDDTPLSFADAYPGLLIGEASLDDLNTRTSIPIVMNRFRPNIVISQVPAYAEDTWVRVEIGGAMIDWAKPCARCVLTTVDPDSGIVGKEPLSTLSQYRRVKNDVYFGQYFVVSKTGIVRIGDAINVVERKDWLFPPF